VLELDIFGTRFREVLEAGAVVEADMDAILAPNGRELDRSSNN
jgi:hypothetical protein